MKQPRERQIDKACYLKWKAAKKRGEYVMPWGWLTKKKKVLRKIEKINFKIVPISIPRFEKALKSEVLKQVNNILARLDERVKEITK